MTPSSLAIIVAAFPPLTATVLAEADESDAGIASAVNKVIRVIVTPVLAAGADDHGYYAVNVKERSLSYGGVITNRYAELTDGTLIERIEEEA